MYMLHDRRVQGGGSGSHAPPLGHPSYKTYKIPVSRLRNVHPSEGGW